MGSLMAGWNSPVSDPKFVKYERNKSLIKEEIDAYWREKKMEEEQQRHLKDNISGPSSDINDHVKESSTYSEESRVKRSSSMPLVNTNKESFMDTDKEISLEKLVKKNAWWTRSNWAFLNEPPVLEGNNKRYASQFHIANLAT
ncbi:hypothetical protein ACOSQ3_011189 [Xanthoceras sorbifolium]